MAVGHAHRTSNVRRRCLLVLPLCMALAAVANESGDTVDPALSGLEDQIVGGSKESKSTEEEKSNKHKPPKVGIALGFEYFNTEYIDDSTLGPDRRVITTTSTNWRNNLWAYGSWEVRGNFELFVASKIVSEDGKAGIKDAAVGFLWRGGSEDFHIGFGVANHRVRSYAAGVHSGRTLPSEFGGNIPFHDHSEWGFIALVTHSSVAKILGTGK